MTRIRLKMPRLTSKMPIHWSLASIVASLFIGWAPISSAQAPLPPPGTLIVPSSSVAGPNDAGVAAHTYLRFYANGFAQSATPAVGPPFGPGVYYETPASIACLYGLAPPVSGCNPYLATANPTGGSKAIALVEAFDTATLASDLNTFSTQFGLPLVNPGTFQVVYAPPGASCSGAATQPPTAAGTGWDIEASLDAQWAHAMAPNATIYVVEAQSNSNANLFCAVSVANLLVSSAGGGEISMSWGGSEFSTETATDALFTAANVVYFASSGDGPGVGYPSASPNVVAVGGTTISRNLLGGSFRFENTWQSGGGGRSAYEPRPAYQNSIAPILSPSPNRGVPDVSADANPDTGVWVFNSTYLSMPVWFIVGGTSLSSPLWAGITNAAGAFSSSSFAELTNLYADPSGDFNDITLGTCGPFMGYVAAGGWDFCTGRGSPKTYSGK